MRVTILIIALIVGGHTVDAGYPWLGYGLIAMTFWEATMQQSCNKPGHWAQVALRRGAVSLFFVMIAALAVTASFQAPNPFD